MAGTWTADDLRGLKADDVAEAHRRDVDIQDRHGVKYMAYWFDENNGAAFCLVHAPDPATAGPATGVKLLPAESLLTCSDEVMVPSVSVLRSTA